MRPHRWVVAGALAASLALPSPAESCICPLTTVDVWPSGGSIVPTNTHVWISFALDKGWDDTTITPGELVFAIRPPEPTRAQKKKAKKSKKKGKDAAAETAAAPSVDITVRTGTSGKLGWVELTPTAPLTPDVRYRVTMMRTNAPDGSREAVIAEFTAGATADSTPPTWAGAAKEAVVATGRGPAGVCGTTALAAVVRFAAGSWGGGAAAAPPEQRYAVWRGTEPTEQRPPTVIVPARSDGFVLGTASACATENFALAAGAESLIVRPIDVAGNLGAPANVALRPEKRSASR